MNSCVATVDKYEEICLLSGFILIVTAFLKYLQRPRVYEKFDHTDNIDQTKATYARKEKMRMLHAC